MRDEGKARSWTPGLIRLRVRPSSHHISRGRIVLATGDDGFFWGQSERGLFIHQTRFLSHYRMSVNGRPLQPVSLSNVDQDHWQGFYLAENKTRATAIADTAQQALEIRLSRRIRDSLQEDVTVTNYTQKRRRLVLSLTLASDFADLIETQGRRRQRGRQSVVWRTTGSELITSYRATHRYSHQGDRGEVALDYSFRIRIRPRKTRPVWRQGAIHFRIALEPHEVWKCRLDMSAHFKTLPQRTMRLKSKRSLRAGNDGFDDFTVFDSGESHTLAPVVIEALKQGQRDLAALRLFDLDQPDGGWVPAAGLPLYVALFGRDTLTAAWEAAPLTINLMRGTLPALAARQGKIVDDWRDEMPGRMLHEMHTGPLSIQNYIPQPRLRLGYDIGILSVRSCTALALDRRQGAGRQLSRSGFARDALARPALHQERGRVQLVSDEIQSGREEPGLEGLRRCHRL